MSTATASSGAFRDMPIGIEAEGHRTESDPMGDIDVPADRYWGAQTQHSLIHFYIGDQRMPKAVHHARGYVKKATAMKHKQAGRMDADVADAILQACDEINSTMSFGCTAATPS